MLLTSFVMLLTGLAMVRSQAIMDCENYNPNICFSDVVPFCLQNGTIVISICEAKRAVCRCGGHQYMTDLLWLISYRQFGYCNILVNFGSSFDSSLFSMVKMSFCFMSVHAFSSCRENAQLDETFAACRPQQPNFDCDNFNPMVCSKDTIPFCLTDGTAITGRCEAQKAVCKWVVQGVLAAALCLQSWGCTDRI